MVRGPEARLQDRVVRMFRSNLWLAQKNSSGAGWPDFTFISPSAFVLLAEFKAPGQPLRPIQKAWHRDFKFRQDRSINRPPELVIWDDFNAAWDWLQKYNRYAI